MKTSPFIDKKKADGSYRLCFFFFFYGADLVYCVLREPSGLHWQQTDRTQCCVCVCVCGSYAGGGWHERDVTWGEYVGYCVAKADGVSWIEGLF